ncbi:prefoldin subunit alpha [Methanorbis furvi]|uniref:Prefoldin subunit alpha n=1 Tax=Methanorbis furvi TaxID=3028299 RepID=A0AAE4MCY5_9EURY|nr:Prefoldin subunit alpha [Methanocorpusculaceae archaeon Ag1]
MASNVNQANLEQEVQALRSYAAEYSQQFDLLSQQLRFIETARAEALASVEALEALAAADGEVSTLLSLGGGVSVRATVTDTKRMLVGIGAGVTVEKSTEDALSFLRDRITEMDASGKRLSESLGKLQSQMSAVEQRMQEIYASAQKQIR